MRAKTLFASTRATLVKELGIEGGTLFATEIAEVLDPREWEERDRRDGAGTDEALLTREERELQGVKRAEDEERHGTKGRDLMGSEASSGAGGGKSVGVAMKMDDAGKEPLRELAQCGESEEGMVVQFVSLVQFLSSHVLCHPCCLVVPDVAWPRVSTSPPRAYSSTSPIRTWRHQTWQLEYRLTFRVTLSITTPPRRQSSSYTPVLALRR